MNSLAVVIALVIGVGVGIDEIHASGGSPTPVLISTNTTPTVGSLSNNTIQLNVVTSVSPITNIVKNIGGDRIKLTGLIPEGINSHTYELVPSDRIKIENANLAIIDGLNLEGNIERAVKQAQSKNHQLQLLKLADNTITKNQWIFDFSFPKERGDPNPHLWLIIAYTMRFANITRDKLIEMDPQNVDYYSSNEKDIS
jgi:ABC-type Zn uptake system ZnuABC Zn-binding protein ZnuA